MPRLRPVLQSEAGECGLACLAMVAGWHGHRTSLRQLRQRFPLSLKGASLPRLLAVAGALGLQGRALRVELGQLAQLRLPCVLHWDLNHYIVLAGIDRRGARLVDPASGERRLPLAEVSRHFTGVALELAPGEDFRRQPPPPAPRLRELIGPVQGAARALAGLLALSVALQVFVLLAPFFLQWVVDQALVAGDRELLTVLALGFVLALVLQVGIGLLRGWTLVLLASRLGRQWTGNVFAQALRLPLAWFEKRHLGDIVSRMGAVQAIQRTLTTSFLEAVIDGLMALATLAMMLVYSPRLAVVSLVVVALYLGARAAAFRPLRDGTERQLLAGARQQGFLLESLRGMPSLKVAGEEAARIAGFRNLVVDTVNAELRLARLALGFGNGAQLLFGLERIAVVWLGARMAMDGGLADGGFSVGMLMAYLAWKDQFAARVSALVDKALDLRLLRLHGERLADIVLATPDDEPGDDYEAPPPASLRIEVQGLGFRYAEGEPWVLRDCSFVLEPGESLAIVGASGGGKTTLLKLLLGLLPPGEGRILVDGRDLHRFGRRRFRTLVGAVMQDDQLFAGSVADNIAFGDPGVDMARVEAAARLAAVHEDIAAMPMGYHALIGDMGTTLSGGQKQRVILARALYRQPRILFLDEATSHLDVARERLVNEAVRRLRIGKLIVAHRPETIAAADRALVLQGGRIVQEFRPPPAVAGPAAAPAAVGAG